MSDEYADAKLRRAMAEEVEIAELGIEIVPHGDWVALHGQVETPQRREAIERRVAQQLPGCRVLNEIVVLRAEAPGRPEELG